MVRVPIRILTLVRAVQKEEPKGKTKLVYYLKSKDDLINILKTSPGIPVFHIFNGKNHIYITHTLGDYVFLFKSKEEIPEQQTIPFSGERNINLVNIESVKVMSLQDLEKIVH